MPSSAWKTDVCSRSEEHTSELQSLTNLVCRLIRSEEHTSELQSLTNLVCRLLLEKKKGVLLSLYGRGCCLAGVGLGEGKSPCFPVCQSGTGCQRGKRGTIMLVEGIMKKLLFVLTFLLGATCLLAADLSLDDLIKKLEASKSQVKDFYAETSTKMYSDIKFNQKGKASQSEQKGKLWQKGKDKTKIELLTPKRLIMVRQGREVVTFDPVTGQKMRSSLDDDDKKQLGEPTGEFTLERAKKIFTLSVRKQGNDYIVTGIPKQQQGMVGKMEIYINSSRWLPDKIIIYDLQGKKFGESKMEYQQVNNIWVLKKTYSVNNTPIGKMEITMEYSNTKVNQGLDDKEFEVD